MKHYETLRPYSIGREVSHERFRDLCASILREKLGAEIEVSLCNGKDDLSVFVNNYDRISQEQTEKLKRMTHQVLGYPHLQPEFVLSLKYDGFYDAPIVENHDDTFITFSVGVDPVPEVFHCPRCLMALKEGRTHTCGSCGLTFAVLHDSAESEAC